jgi:hypothetical protein
MMCGRSAAKERLASRVLAQIARSEKRKKRFEKNGGIEAVIRMAKTISRREPYSADISRESSLFRLILEKFPSRKYATARLNESIEIPSGQDNPDHMNMNIGQAAFDSVVVIGQSLMIQTEQVKDGGMKVVRRGDIFDSFESEFVSATVRYARLDARALARLVPRSKHDDTSTSRVRITEAFRRTSRHKKQQTALLLFFSSDGKRSAHDG